MNQLTLQGASLMLFMSLALAPVVSFAAIDVNTSSNTDASVDSGADVNATLSDKIIEVEVGGNATSTSSSTDEDAEVRNDTEANTSFRLNANGIAIMTASEVKSDADLEVYAANMAASEERVDDIVVDEDADGNTRVEVHYDHDGKLFGVMPVTVTSKTMVTFHADGEIEAESDLPWWSFMVTGINHAESEIESRVLDNPTVMASAEAELSASTKAHVAEAIVAELKAHSDLQANLNAE